MKLAGKVAMVTGAGRGIGRAVALKLSEEGASLVINDLEKSYAESVAHRIEQSGRVAVPIQADVSSRQDVTQLFEQTIEQFGRLDILINNAGVRKDANFHEMLEKDWDSVINTALKGSFNCAQAAQKYMVKQSYGKILNIASPVTAAIVAKGQVNYVAANAGLEGFTRALAKELGPYNINVNCVEPDFIDTEMLRNTARREGMYLDDLKKFVVAEIPLRRLGITDDVANLALFLVTDESSYISGQIIAIKGGP
jgi:3-oxoacyl-[acyl-carrier protein] reductase